MFASQSVNHNAESLSPSLSPSSSATPTPVPSVLSASVSPYFQKVQSCRNYLTGRPDSVSLCRPPPPTPTLSLFKCMSVCPSLSVSLPGPHPHPLLSLLWSTYLFVCLCVVFFPFLRLCGVNRYPVNMLDPIRKSFGYGQLWPLRPACSQNRAGSYTPDPTSRIRFSSVFPKKACIVLCKTHPDPIWMVWSGFGQRHLVWKQAGVQESSGPVSGRTQPVHYQFSTFRLGSVLPQTSWVILCKTSPDPI